MVGIAASVVAVSLWPINYGVDMFQAVATVCVLVGLSVIGARILMGIVDWQLGLPLMIGAAAVPGAPLLVKKVSSTSHSGAVKWAYFCWS